MSGKYEFFLDEAADWYEAATGYSKDDDRYRECMDKYYHHLKYAQLTLEVDYAHERLLRLDDVLGYCTGWSNDERQMLLNIRNATCSKWKEAVSKKEAYEVKILG